MDWLLIKGMRVIRISDEPEQIYPVHEPKDEKKRREAREAQRRSDYSLRHELDALENMAESLSSGAEVEVPIEPAEPATASVSSSPAPASNPRAATQAQALVEAAREGTPLCEN